MIDAVKNIFSIPDLRRRVLFTFLMLAVYRVGGHIPVPGVNFEALEALFKTQGGGLLGFLAGSLQDPGGLGLGAGADVLGFGGGTVELAAVGGLGERGSAAIRGPAPDDYERKYHREQPDYHERERQSAAHGNPFPSIALGAPWFMLLSRTRVYALVRAVARHAAGQLIFSSALTT